VRVVGRAVSNVGVEIYMNPAISKGHLSVGGDGKVVEHLQESRGDHGHYTDTEYVQGRVPIVSRAKLIHSFPEKSKIIYASRFPGDNDDNDTGVRSYMVINFF